LAAARTLVDHGVEVVILEARDRTGGRCWTQDGVDLGAHWIHGTEGNPLTNLARRQGVDTLFVGGDSSYSGGWDHIVLHGEDGRRLSYVEKMGSILLADEVRDDLDSLRRRRVAFGETDISYRDALDRILATRELSAAERQQVEWHIALTARDDCAADDSALSFLWWDEGYEVYGYGDSLFVRGYGAVIEALTRGLDVRLQHVVECITHSPVGVTVATDKGDFTADAVIVTLPLGVLKAGAVEFSPPLSAGKQMAIERLGMGDLAKIVVHFAHPFWPIDQYVFGYLCRPLHDRPSMIVNMWKTHDIPALVLLAGGCLAREIERWSIEKVSAWATDVLRDVFGDQVPEPESIQRTQWDVDPYSRGSYSFVAVGSTPDDIDELAKPIGTRVCFAGEATNRHHWAGAHGAYASGIREAARLLNDPAVLPSRAFVENRRWRDTVMRATRLFNLLSNSIDANAAEERVEFLAECDVFSAVPAHELRVLVTMFEPVTFAAGETICRIGDKATCVYALSSGEVEVRLSDEALIATLGRGKVVGEFGLFQASRRTATLVARTDVEALSLDYQRFQRFLLAFPESQLALLSLTVDRLVQQSQRK
jgi:hypothetical protein